MAENGNTDLYARGLMTAKELKRFFGYVLPEPNTGCWLWIGSRQNKGYGVFWLASAQKQVLAHRLFYLQAGCLIPSGCELHHLCETPVCVNPDHLEPVTHRENLRRGSGWSGKNAQKSHCLKGHPYSVENTYSAPSRPVNRHCKECNRIRAATHYYHTRKVTNPRRLNNPREATSG